MAKDIGNAKNYSEEDLRFATPLNVAKRRAEDLRCDCIVDLCSGIGIQAGAFAKTCKQVFGFEIDARKVKYSEKNFNLKNLKFICGDVMDEKVIERVKEIKPDIIFCDPERLPSEKERNLESIKPNLKRLVEVYSGICRNICLEVPPRIDLDKLNALGDTEELDSSVPKISKTQKISGCEKEYLSLDNKLNRLDLKFGNLKKDERSVVDVSSGMRIVNNPARKAKVNDRILNYVYDVSEAVVKADLVDELACLVFAEILKGCEKNRVLLTSKEPSLEFGCFAKPYVVIGIVSKFEEINVLLRKKGFGKAVIKYSIEPKNYWKERSLLEKGLRGEREAVVFKVGNKFVVCEFFD